MSIKTWQERQAATGVGSISAKEDEIDELRAELARCTGEIEQLTETAMWQAGRISELLDAVAAMTAERDDALYAGRLLVQRCDRLVAERNELKADAERYQWMTAQIVGDTLEVLENAFEVFADDPGCSQDEFDAAIDAAMKGKS